MNVKIGFHKIFSLLNHKLNEKYYYTLPILNTLLLYVDRQLNEKYSALAIC
jgi:hypothetical protein